MLSYKANLLREAAKLAEMEGNWRRRAVYDRLYEEVFKAHQRLSQALADRKDAGEDEGVPRRPADDFDPSP